MSVAEKLTQLNTIKGNIKTAIIAKGQTVGDNMTTYATAIMNISGGITPSGTLNITANGTYDVSTYADVSVNVSGGETIIKFVDRTLSGVYTVPNGTTKIGAYAFAGCTQLTKVIIPDSVTVIDNYAFNGCSALVEVVLPSNITSLPSYVFNSCSSLTTITIPESVTYIGSYAFGYCYGLTSITIPENVAELAFGAFYGCNNLATIYSNRSTPPTISSYTFYGVKNGGVLYIPPGTNYSTWLNSSSYYLGYYNWTSEYSGYCITYTTTDGNALTLSGEIADVSIKTHIYSGSKGVIEFESEPTTLDASSFAMQSTLSTIDFSGVPSITTLPNDCFKWCENLSQITGQSFTQIGYACFLMCTSLTSFDFSNITSIGNIGFGDSGLAGTLILPDSMTQLNYHVFENTDITSVVIPNTITYIGNMAFSGTTSCTSYNMSSYTQVPTFGTDPFGSAEQRANTYIYVKNASMETAFKAALPKYASIITSGTYTEYSKIVTDGNCYIDINEALTADSIFEIRCEYPSLSNNYEYFGRWNGESSPGSYRLIFNGTAGYSDLYVWNNRLSLSRYSDFGSNEAHTIKIELNDSENYMKLYLDNVLKDSKHNSAAASAYNNESCWLFALKDATKGGATTYCPTGFTVYSFKWWKNGVLVRDMVPAQYQAQNGMWDKQNNVFYRNSGTGTFTLSN